MSEAQARRDRRLSAIGDFTDVLPLVVLPPITNFCQFPTRLELRVMRVAQLLRNVGPVATLKRTRLIQNDSEGIGNLQSSSAG